MGDEYAQQFAAAIKVDVGVKKNDSAIAALKTLRERYAKAGKHLKVVHLSARCRQLLRRAGVQAVTRG